MTLAHGLGSRSDLPIPLWLAVCAGAVAVTASFVVLAATWRTPRLRGAAAGRSLLTLQRLVDARPVCTGLRVLGLLLLTCFLMVAWLGPDDNGRHNPAPTWFYVWFWVGLVPMSTLLGPIWRALNPLRLLAALAHALLRLPHRAIPARIAGWPAEAGLIAFLWLELVSDNAASPRAVATFVTFYACVHVGAGAVYGQAWFSRNDAFEVYSELLSRAAPLGRRPDGQLVLRNPLDGLTGAPREPDVTPVILILLGSTAFDGSTRTFLWAQLVADTSRMTYLVLGTAGLLTAIAITVLSYGLAVTLTRRHLHHTRDAYAEFGHSLIPIAVGYAVAHYFSFALFQGQQGVLLATDPLSRGWDLLGLEGTRVNYTLMSSDAIAFVQTGAIVLGHIVGLIVAHDRALSLLPRRHARSGQCPMLAVMVVYTTVGIALLAGA